MSFQTPVCYKRKDCVQNHSFTSLTPQYFGHQPETDVLILILQH